MDVDAPTPLLAGLSPAQFMRRHWEKKPLLVRQAWPGVKPPISRAGLFRLASDEDVESRLVVREGDDWLVRHGPMPRRVLPPVSQRGWTLLVQGLDLHLDTARALLQPFRFVPDARLDDVMVSWASDGGGVGPHVDAYDVFLLQVAGRRRWRVGPVSDAAFIEGLPLKILQHFEPAFDWVLEPGDLLYLPPGWGHDGVAEGECMTASVGFRSPGAEGLAGDLLQRLADAEEPGLLYRDPSQPATARPGEMPAALVDFARKAVARRLSEAGALERALGESLSEPKPRVWFDAGGEAELAAGVCLDRRSRMLYDARHVYLNGESFRIGGRDARLMRQLADTRVLPAAGCAALSPAARHVVQAWLDDGWLQPLEHP
jgi:50S ribosomal protein L16 3-hydroxylase